MVYMIIPTTNLVCVLFDPVIPTSSFNFIVFLFLCIYVSMYVCMYVCMYNMYVYGCVCMYVCIIICIFCMYV